MSKTQKPVTNNDKPSASKPVTFLLTGFDAFAGDKYNPSQMVVESFPHVLESKTGQPGQASLIHIRKQVLPTAGARGWKILKRALNTTLEQAPGPVVVLMLGLAAARKTLNLERLALNFRDYSLPDNDGVQRRDQIIETAAPQMLRTNLDLPALQAALNKAGYASDISNHAGTFICNELYFRALSYKRKSRKLKAVMFVHLPLESVFAKTTLEGHSNPPAKARAETLDGIAVAQQTGQIKLLQEAMVRAVEEITNQIAKPPRRAA